MKCCKPILLFNIFLLCSLTAFSQPAVQHIKKNNDYRNAIEWLGENKFIYDSLSAYGIPPDEAIAIVFPELMHFSALRNKMEVTGLMVLYARLGKGYADFSVGRFQMKPSFVRHLEIDAGKYLSRKEMNRICPFLLNGKDVQGIRRKRVSSLTNVRNEVSYLALFYKICLKRFKAVHFKSVEERVRFLATAYNCGYHHSAKNLFYQMKKKQFPVYDRMLIRHVNYAELALAWWKRKNDVLK